MAMEIAAFNPGSADRKLRRPVLMLRDYLLEDLSSCSSNGFKSFPRRQQCCPSTVRFLLDIDLKAKGDVAARRSSSSKPVHRSSRSLKRSPSKTASATVSGLHRASVKIINAVKLLTFPSISKSPASSVGKSKFRRSLLPRSLSRKLMKKRFWRREEAEEPDIVQWRLFRDFLAEKDPSPDQNSSGTGSATLTTRVSTSSSSGPDGGGGSSWDSSEFSAVETVSTSSGNSNTLDGDAVVSAGKDLHLPPKPEEEEGTVEKQKKVSGRVGVAVGDTEEVESPGATPTAAISKDWPNEEKEQLSPVSVLDCPFEDDDEEISSASEYGSVLTGGAREKHGHKGFRIKSLSQLEPLNLDQRLAFSELDNGLLESTRQPYSTPSPDKLYAEENEIINVKAEELLRAIKMNNPRIGLEEDNLLSDFFIEKLESGCACELEALETAKDWVSGAPREIRTGWEGKSGRAAYVKDMDESCRGWKNSREELHEVAVELEVEVWRSLVEEILLDL